MYLSTSLKRWTVAAGHKTSQPPCTIVCESDRYYSRTLCSKRDVIAFNPFQLQNRSKLVTEQDSTAGKTLKYSLQKRLTWAHIWMKMKARSSTFRSLSPKNFEELKKTFISFEEEMDHPSVGVNNEDRNVRYTSYPYSAHSSEAWKKD